MDLLVLGNFVVRRATTFDGEAEGDSLERGERRSQATRTA
jgi:hypothetical protein